MRAKMDNAKVVTDRVGGATRDVVEPTRILIVGQLPPPQHGSNVMTDITLGTLKRIGYEPIFVDKSFSHNIRSVGKPSIRKILRLPVLALEVVRVCLSKKPALCMYFIAAGVTPVFVDAFVISFVRLCNVPYVLNFHGKGFRENLQNANLLWRKIVAHTLTRALGGIVLCDALRQDVNMVIPDSSLFPVPNAIQDRPRMPRHPARDYVQVLFLSNLAPAKGPFEFLMAASIVHQKRHDVRFVIAGADWDTNYTEELRAYVDEHGLRPFVDFRGGVFEKAKDELFSSSDIFVFPTHFETFGLVNLEAMRAGLPVVSSSEGAIPEVVQDGVTGFIVDSHSPEEIAERICLLVDDPELREAMGAKGREVFESKYTLEAYAESMEKCMGFFLRKKGS